jgi:AcrR family transcriptional regulator
MTSILDLLVTAGKWQMMHILLDDDLGRLTVQRLRPWHRLLARCLAPRLDRRLADGARPEENAVLAARAMVLTSVSYRRALAETGSPSPHPSWTGWQVASPGRGRSRLRAWPW